MNDRRIAGALACALALLLNACGTTATKPEPYENSFLRPPLDVPPGLAIPDTEGSLGIPAPVPAAPASADNDGTQLAPVLPQFPDIHLERAGSERWLVLQAKPQQVWDLLQQFIQGKGMTIVQQLRPSGIIDTAWQEIEPRAAKASDAKPQVLGARAAYRFRLEPGEQPGTTELYISRRAVHEVAVAHGSAWESAPPDPEAEADMLQTFMVFAGMSEQNARAQLAAAPAAYQAAIETSASGNPQLRFHDNLDRGWSRAGVALERIGWLIKDRDRSQWTYRVQQAENGGKKPGFFARLFNRHSVSSGQVYLVALRAGADGWVELDLTQEGGAPAPKAVAEPFFKMLYEQMK